MNLKKIIVNSQNQKYSIFIGQNIISGFSSILKNFPPSMIPLSAQAKINHRKMNSADNLLLLLRNITFLGLLTLPLVCFFGVPVLL